MSFWMAFALYLGATLLVIGALSINGKTEQAGGGHDGHGHGHGHDDHGHGGHGHH